MIKETDSTYFSQVFYPWRRFLARSFDISMYNILWSVFLAFIFHVNVAARSGSETLLDTFIVFIMMLFLEPLFLRLFGTTPGKFIFGLRIENPDGEHLFYNEGLDRTLRVIGTGMGYNIPIYNIIRLLKSYTLCRENEIQPWDESISYTIKDTKWYRGLFYIVASIASFAVLFTIMSAQLLPPNKGDLTVAEFAENYNYYANLFDIDLGDEYMNETGKWEKKKTDGSVIYIGLNEKPEYHFTMENGYLTGVSFAIETENEESFITPYDKQMFLSSLAFACAQNEMRLFSKIPNRIADKIDNNIFKDYNFAEAGITFMCDIEYSGYRETQSHLMFPSNTDENYFSLKFSMNK
ncbi:RDD family protein [Sedimentibacter sp.]|uniref:RDD family protein n=1 Tax=Sedimentibacter sp. TaxID=1960295 RepID=UPI0028AEF36A|nr:RDD family protein [Sedimentibacter sp.]